MIDRDIQASDQTLRLSIISSNLVEECEKAGLWFANYLIENSLDDGITPINIVELEGTYGSATGCDRKSGIANIMAQHSNWTMLYHAPANFVADQGETVMAGFLTTVGVLRFMSFMLTMTGWL